jgi:hypothetical protein
MEVRISVVNFVSNTATYNAYDDSGVYIMGPLDVALTNSGDSITMDDIKSDCLSHAAAQSAEVVRQMQGRLAAIQSGAQTVVRIEPHQADPLDAGRGR